MTLTFHYIASGTVRKRTNRSMTIARILDRLSAGSLADHSSAAIYHQKPRASRPNRKRPRTLQHAGVLKIDPNAYLQLSIFFSAAEMPDSE